MQLIGESFFQKDTVTVARELLGKYLVHDAPEGRTAGRIVETEAYLSTIDPASHAYRGMTSRNKAMFGAPGRAYIYFIYGMHYCFNVVTSPPGVGEAVLIRALEPVEGVELMMARRGTSEVRNLCSGPAKLVQAMGMSAALDGHDLRKAPLTLQSNLGEGNEEEIKHEIVVTKRIGITAATDLPLRFYLKGSTYASRRCQAR